MKLVTPPLDDVILPGITRQSTVELARGHESGVGVLSGLEAKLIVSERPIAMKEIVSAAESGSLVEIFGTGSPIVIEIEIPRTHCFQGPLPSLQL